MAETLLLAAPYIAAAGTAVSAIASLQGSQQQSAALTQQAAVNPANAEQARANAGIAANAGEAETARTEADARRRSAAAFNSAAASGVDPGFGSPLDLMADMAAEGALDVQIQRWKSRQQAQGYMVQASNFEAQARGNRGAAADVAAAGPIRAGTTLLGGLAQFATIGARR
jgi:hypothetical protein